MHKLLCALTLALGLAACAPKNYVVVLENPSGGPSEVTVTTNNGSQVLAEAGTATTINKASSAPSRPWSFGLDNLKEVFERAIGARPPKSSHFTIYFEFGGTKVAAESAATVQAMVADARHRPAPDATVDGYADTVASDDRNLGLALLRAWKIRDVLVGAGVDLTRIEVTTYGESKLAVETPDNVKELRNRRVEVTLR